MPFGSFFWIIGFVIFIVAQLKTKSLIYATIPMSIYFVIIGNVDGLIVNAYSRMAMQYVGLILTLVGGYYLYMLVKGK